QLLLAIDDPVMAVSAEHRDVARMHPPVVIDRLSGLDRVVVVPAHHVAAAHEQLAVVAQAHLDSWKRKADRWGLVVSERNGCRRARELAHAPDLIKRHPE